MKYEKPTMEIEVFNTGNILTISGQPGGDGPVVDDGDWSQ